MLGVLLVIGTDAILGQVTGTYHTVFAIPVMDVDFIMGLPIMLILIWACQDGGPALVTGWR